MNRAVFALVAILCLLSVSSITGFIPKVKADSVTIYINADGSISPSTAPIYTADNVTYTLTGNITSDADGIVIERNNIVLNGAGYTLSGSGSGDGTTLTNLSNVTINNMIIKNFGYGVGVYLWSPFDCTLSGNTITASKYAGIMLNNSPGNTLFGNNTLSGNNVANDGYGIWLYSSSNCTLSGNNVTANKYDGITLDSSCDNNTLSGNNVTANNGYGIVLTNSSDNTIFFNNFVSNTNQTYTDGLANIWVRNYWSDYLTKYPNATQIDSSGVWNTPYVIDANNTDGYPLVVPVVVVPEFPAVQATMFLMLLTLLAVIIYKKKGVSTRQL